MERMIPFSAEALLALFEDYNAGIWPVQIAAHCLAAILLLLTLRRAGADSRTVGLLLVIFWLVNGVVFHGLYFARINIAASGFAVLFVVQALLIAWCLLIRDSANFRFDGGLLG